MRKKERVPDACRSISVFISICTAPKLVKQFLTCVEVKKEALQVIVDSMFRKEGWVEMVQDAELKIEMTSAGQEHRNELCIEMDGLLCKKYL